MLPAMARKFMGLFALAALLGIPHPCAAEPAAPRIDDPALLAASDVAWAGAAEARLADFERATGITILVQFHPKSPPPDEDRLPGAYMRALSTRLGVIRRGVLMVYFADDPDWRVWVGDELTPVFVGKPGTAAEFTASGAMHQAKEAYLAASLARADAAFAALGKSAPPGKPVPQGRRLALQADALVEGMMGRLRPN